jgi:hypothetical protein
MTPATTEPARITHGRRTEGHGLIMFALPAYPFWSLIIIAVDLVALYGLCANGSRISLTAQPGALTGHLGKRGCRT